MKFADLLDPIDTNVPGIRISEHLPKLAKVADKFAILRGVSHTLAAHRLGSRIRQYRQQADSALRVSVLWLGDRQGTAERTRDPQSCCHPA